MDNSILDLIKIFSSNKEKEIKPPEISKELKEQYPYGEFPIRYTKSGQEQLRRTSEHRFSYENIIEEKPPEKDNSLNLELLLPLIQSMSGKNKPDNILELISKILFKDNPEMSKLFKLFPKKNNVDIKNTEVFPDTNVVKISSLKRID